MGFRTSTADRLRIEHRIRKLQQSLGRKSELQKFCLSSAFALAA